MKKLLTLALSLASIGFVNSSAKAAESATAPAATIAANTIAPHPGIQRGQGMRSDNRSPNIRIPRARITTQTLLVRHGRQLYRETYQVTYRPNGKTITKLISRVKVR